MIHEKQGMKNLVFRGFFVSKFFIQILKMGTEVAV